MKKCPYCAEEIQDEAIICKHCKMNLTETQPPKPVYVTPPSIHSTGQKKSPALGGFGLLIIAVSVFMCLIAGTDNITGAAIVAVIGAVIVIIALVTGRINLFGSK